MALTPQILAEKFHEIYERRARGFSYETRPETRVFDPESQNGKLMIAVCDELMSEGSGVGICDLEPGDKMLAPNVLVQLEITFMRAHTIDMAITKHKAIGDKGIDELCYSMAEYALNYFQKKLADLKPRIQIVDKNSFDPKKLN